jgi:hypothetical protein
MSGEPNVVLVWTRVGVYVVKRRLRAWTVRLDARRKAGDVVEFLEGDGMRASYEGDVGWTGSFAALLVARSLLLGEDPASRLADVGYTGRVQTRQNAPKPPKIKNVDDWFADS